MLAFWLGGAAAFPEIIPPEPGAPGGGWGGPIHLPSVEIWLKQLDIFGDQFSDEEQAAILAAIMWTLK